jgi:hypothetical protein
MNGECGQLDPQNNRGKENEIAGNSREKNDENEFEHCKSWKRELGDGKLLLVYLQCGWNNPWHTLCIIQDPCHPLQKEREANYSFPSFPSAPKTIRNQICILSKTNPKIPFL